MKKILLIEDDLANYVYFKALLGILKVDYIHADDGKKALNIFNDIKNDIKLIILDVRLPYYNGFELLKIFKNEKNNIPIICITANPYDNDELKLSDDFLLKPFKPDEFFKMIKKYI